jgi:predicted CoA-binding protein
MTSKTNDKELKPTLVLGASPKPDRYAYKAIKMLEQYGHPVVAVGNKEVDVDGVPIVKSIPANETIDTLTMYLSARNQVDYYDAILSLKPKRVIFNPGAENYEFSRTLNEQGIETENACTLVLLSIGAY